MQEQAAKLCHVSNLYHTEPGATLARRLVDTCFAGGGLLEGEWGSVGWGGFGVGHILTISVTSTGLRLEIVLRLAGPVD